MSEREECRIIRRVGLRSRSQTSRLKIKANSRCVFPGAGAQDKTLKYNVILMWLEVEDGVIAFILLPLPGEMIFYEGPRTLRGVGVQKLCGVKEGER